MASAPRNARTQRHTDLRNEFYEQVKKPGATPDVEVLLREQIARLKKTAANKDKELTRLRSDVPALVEVAGGAGVTVKRNDPAALAAALRSVLSDSSQAETMIAAGRRRAPRPAPDRAG